MQKNKKSVEHKFLMSAAMHEQRECSLAGANRWNLLKNKKADMPFWMVMLLWTLAGLFVVLGIVMLQKEKIFAFVEWLG